jgi:hypothetical protein
MLLKFLAGDRRFETHTGIFRDLDAGANQPQRRCSAG